jgi:hypothetical protein
MVDTVVINSTTPPEDPNHADAMAAKFDAAQVPPAGDQNPPTDDTKVEDRPQWLPEKFKSPEDMAKAYAELESKLGKPADNTPADPNAEPKADSQTDQQAADELASKGLNLADFSTEFAAKGELSPESYDKLEKAGYPRNYVDQYIDGQRARAALYESEIKNVAGGDKTFSEMVEWAKANLSPAEINAYNAAIDSGDMEQAKLAVAGVHTRFATSRPSEPNLFKGATSATPSAESYESLAQMQKDMASPEYKSDPAFRAKVERKLANSSIM